jgi:hypothetical protein
MRSIWHEEKTRRLFRRAYEGLHTRKSRKIGKEFTQEKNPIETGKKKKGKGKYVSGPYGPPTPDLKNISIYRLSIGSRIFFEIKTTKSKYED